MNTGYASLLDAEVRRQLIIAELVAIRKANGLTQSAVADLTNVRQSVVSEIESARSDIRFWGRSAFGSRPPGQVDVAWRAALNLERAKRS